MCDCPNVVGGCKNLGSGLCDLELIQQQHHKTQVLRQQQQRQRGAVRPTDPSICADEGLNVEDLYLGE